MKGLSRPVPSRRCRGTIGTNYLLFADVKHMNDAQHQQATGVSNVPILRNLRLISDSKWDGRIVLRCPIIPAFNDTVENAQATATFMHDLGFREINLLPFHRLGTSKYEQLGLAYDYAEQEAVLPEALDHLKAVCEAQKVICYIGYDTPF